VALGAGKPTHAAVRAARELARAGSCDWTEVHVYDPVEEARRRGLDDPDAFETRAALEQALANEMVPRFAAERGEPEGAPGEGHAALPRVTRFVALPSRGEIAETLAEFAEETGADLVVLGTGGPSARRRGSGVAAAALPLVATNSLVVPPLRAEPRAPQRVRVALVATDLSEAGKRALEFAFALLPPATELVLLHVDLPPQQPSGWIMGYPPVAMPTDEERRAKRAQAEAELEELAGRRPEGALTARVEVVDASDVTEAILAAAERHEADLICLGTHHHGRVASALIGSVARTVARRSIRPVLLVPVE
jgi:nucleotide-binding universal stress UspA family protein